MNAEEARELGAALKRWNIPGVVAPEDPDDPDGSWRVYDGPDPETRRDVTADALAALAKSKGPTRGFVIPSR